ncbi:unnamed protein product, partial [Musa banksii]
MLGGNGLFHKNPIPAGQHSPEQLNFQLFYSQLITNNYFILIIIIYWYFSTDRRPTPFSSHLSHRTRNPSVIAEVIIVPPSSQRTGFNSVSFLSLSLPFLFFSISCNYLSDDFSSNKGKKMSCAFLETCKKKATPSTFSRYFLS